MLKIKRITSLICVLLVMLFVTQSVVFADETSSESETVTEIFDSANIDASDLYTMQRGEFTKEISGGGCSVVYLCIKDLYFNTKEAKFVKHHVETGEAVERGQVLASFTIPSSDAEITKRSLAISDQQKKMEQGLLNYDKKIEEAKANVEAASTDYEKEIASLRVTIAETEKKLYQHEQNNILNNLYSQLADLREEYSKNVITAPFDGIIRTLAVVEEGENVAGVPLITIVDPDSRVISANNSTGLVQYNQNVVLSYGRGSIKATSEATVISSNTLFADVMGLSLNSVLGLQPGSNVILIGLKEKEMIEKVALAMTASFRCDYIRLSNVWLIPKELTQKDDKYYYVETLDKGSYRKTYFYAGGDNNKHIWMLEGIDEDAQIIIR